MRFGYAVALLLAVEAAGGDTPKTLPEPWATHWRVLAGDDMEGREPGTPGYDKAANYVESQFRKLGLTPAGAKGYRQPVKLAARLIDGAKTSLTLFRDGSPEKLSLTEDAFPSAGASVSTPLEAGLVFVGHGLVIPEMNLDELAGSNLRGKIALILGGLPPGIEGPLASHAQSAEERWRSLRKAGALGWASIQSAAAMRELPWSRLAEYLHSADLNFAESALDQFRDLRIAALVNPATAERWFAGSGHTLAELLALEASGKSLPHFPLPTRLRSQVTQTSRVISSDNVVALLRGSDPALRDQVVVVSAHLDHLGIGAPIDGDRIYNGALDNAGGVATLLELAARLQASPKKPRRSILFLVPTGEEQGLIGSEYFSKRPTIPRARIVANLNLDNTQLELPWTGYVAFGIDESDLGDDVRAVATARNVEVFPDPHPDRNLFVRSDQYSFVKAGVPALWSLGGVRAGSPEDAIWAEWSSKRYHAPSDDLNQPINAETVRQFHDFTEALLLHIANRDQAPRWKDTSFFKRFATTQH